MRRHITWDGRKDRETERQTDRQTDRREGRTELKQYTTLRGAGVSKVTH
jgi:hypothetical protein